MPGKRPLFSLIAGFIVLVGLTASLGFNLFTPLKTVAANSDTINFQAKLESNDGAIAQDGTYNLEFKLYSASSGGSALWTEDYLNSAGHGVRVVNGYLTVNLGSVTPFPSTIPWDQDMYVTMNVGGTSTGTPTYDGEMNPRLKLTAVPYAFQAKSATQLQVTAGSGLATLGFGTPANPASILLPDQDGTVCLEGDSTGCGFASSSGSGAYIQNGTGLQSNANFNIQSTGIGSPTGVIEALASQSAPLLEFKNSGGAQIAGFNHNGQLYYQNGSFVSTLVQDPAVGQSTSYILPNDAGISSDTICLVTLGNCAGSGTGDTGLGTANTVAIFTGPHSIGNSILSQDSGATTLTVSGDGVISGVLSVVGGSATLGSSSTAGSLILNDGNGGSNQTATLHALGTLGQASTYILPDPGSSTPDTICLYNLGNCVGTGSGDTGTGTAGTLAVFTGGGSSTTIGNSVITEVGTAVTVGGTLSVTGANSLTLGAASSHTGAIVFNGSGGSGTLTVAGPTTPNTGNFTLSIPVITANANLCTDNSICGGYAAASASGAYVQLAPGGAQTDASTNSSIFINKTGASGNLLELQSGSSDRLVVSQSGNLTLSGTQFTNNGSTLETTATPLGDFPTGGSIGTAAATVDAHTTISINQTTSGKTLSLPNPTSSVAGRLIYILNIGTADFTMHGVGVPAGKSQAYIWNGSAWVPSNIDTGGNGASSVGTIDSQSKSANGAVINSNTLYLQSADASFPGLVTTGTQTFAGDKTFGGALTISGSNTLTTGTGTVTLSGRGTGLVLSDNAGVVTTGTADRNSANYFTGTLSIANGGTGATSFTSNGVTYYNGSTLTSTAGTQGQFLIAGSGGVPAFTTLNGDIGSSTSTTGQLTVNKLQGTTLTISALAPGNYVRYNGTAFVNSAIAATDISGVFVLAGTSGTSQTVNGGDTVTIAQGSSGNITTMAGATKTVTVDIVNNPSFSGKITGSSNTTGLALTGTPVAGSGGTSLLQLGSAISGGNSATNGGTYLGVNEPGSGAGSAADFFNFQVGGANKAKLDNTGALTLSGAISAPTSSNTINGLVINGGALSGISGYSQTSGNFAITGSGTFSTGSGNISLNGNTIESGTLAVQGANGVTVGSSTNNGLLNLLDGTSDGFKGTIKLGGAIAADQNYVLPTTGGTFCLQTSSACGFEATSGTDFIRNQLSQQTANFNIVSAAAGDIGGLIQGAGSATQPVLVARAGATPGAGADLFELQDSSTNVNAAFSAAGNQLTLGRAAASGTNTQGKLVFSDGTNSNKTLTLQVGNGSTALSNTTTIKFPTSASSSDTVCLLTLNNCATPNGVTGTGSLNKVARFTGTNTIDVGLLTDDGANFVGVNNTGSSATFNISSVGAQSAAFIQGAASGANPVAIIASGGGTGDLLQLQDNASHSVAKFDTTGDLTLGRVGAGSGATLSFGNGTNSNVAILAAGVPTGGSNATFTLPSLAGGSYTLCTTTTCAAGGGSGSYIQNIKPSTDPIQSANFFIKSADTAANPTAVIEQASGQTGDLLQFLSSAGGTPIAKVDASGNIYAAGFDAASSGPLNIGATNATSIELKQNTNVAGTLTASGLTTLSGGLTIKGGAGTDNGNSTTFTNNNATLNTAKNLGNLSSGSLGTAAATVDVATTLNIAETTASQSLTIPSPTTTTAGRLVYINNTGTASFDITTTNNGTITIPAKQGRSFEWSGPSGAWNIIDNTLAGTGLGQSGNTITSAAPTSVTNDTNVTGSIASNVLTLGWTGTLSVARGGTGTGSLTSNGVIYGGGTSALQATAAGTQGQLLFAGSGGTPAFTTLSGDISSSSSTTGALTVSSLQGNTLTISSPLTGQFLKYNGSAFVNSGITASDVTGTLFSVHANAGTDQTVSSGQTVSFLPGSSSNLTTTTASGTRTVTVDIVQNPTFTGTVTANNNTGVALAVSGTPTAGTTTSLFQLGGAIASGNNATNGGTYLGLNEPTSGLGSAADLVNLQRGGSSVFQIASTGSITASSLTNGGSGGLVVSNGSGTLSSATVNRNSTTYFNTALTVANGGTGLATTTPYGLIAAGTTATGVFQQVGTGSSGQVLISGGSSGLPTFQSATAANTCTDCIRQAPTSTAQNTIQPATSGVVGLTVNGTNTGTAATAVNIVQAGNAADLTLSNTASTGGNLISLTQNTSAYSGTALLLNLAAGSGSFSGNFLDLQKNGASQLSIDNTGKLTFGTDTSLFRSAAGTLTVQGQGSVATTFITKAGSSQSSTDLFQVQNSSGNPLAGFNSSGQLYLGRPSNTVGQVNFYGSGSANSIALVGPTSPGSGLTLTLPNETGTLCSTGSICTGYAASSGSNSYIQNTGGSATPQASANFNIQATTSGTAGTIGGIIRGASGGQTVDLLQLQSSAGTPVLNVTAGGNLNLATTSSTGGQITQGGQTLIHTYGVGNFFAGPAAGNLTLTVGLAQNNNGIGANALQSLTTGFNNEGNGVNALQSLTTGSYNAAFGDFALSGSVSGIDNTGVGASALQFTNGNLNTGIGQTAGTGNTTGSSNTFIGAASNIGTTNQLQNATAIGAAATVNNSNALSLGCVGGVNTCSSSVNVGIGVADVQSRLQVQSDPVSGGAATISSGGTGGTTVTGSGTSFTTQAKIGDTIIANNQARRITFITNDTSLTIDTAFNPNLSAGTTFTLTTPIETISNTGATLFRNSSNSTSAFQIQNAAGTSNLLIADTTNTRIGIGAAPANGLLTIGTNTTAATGGLYFGTDTNLYRGAAGTLQTDGSLVASGNTLSTAANGTIGGLSVGTTLTKNDTNTRTFYGVNIQPTINTGASNTTTTFNVLNIDTTNTATTGVTTNLLRLAYGGTQKLAVDSSGSITAASLTNGGNGGLIVSNSSGVLSSTTVDRNSGTYFTSTQLSVANGGTGLNTAANPYGIIFAGTTSSGAFQNSLANGTSGTILKSGGSNTLPSWVAATGANTCTDCILQAPTNSTTNVIAPATSGIVGLVVKGTNTGTSADSLDIYNSASTPTLQDFFDSSGALNVNQTVRPVSGNNSVDLGLSSGTTFRSGYFGTSVLTPTLDTNSAVTLNIGASGGPVTSGIALNQNTTIASGKNLTFNGGASNFDQHSSSGTFQTGTGAVSLNGDTTVSSGNLLTAAGRTLSLQADQTVGSAVFNTTLTKNDTNTRSFYGVNIQPTLNTGGSNTTTTFNVLNVDTTNTATTGVTTNLLRLAYGGTPQLTVDSAGNVAHTGNLNINTGKFTVTASNGNTVVGGTLQVKGLTTAGLVLTDASGNLTSGALDRNNATYFNTALSVGNGGTGLSSFTTPYGLIAGGTTTTGSLQQVGTGTSGQLLKSGGNGALPSWVNNVQANVCSDCATTTLSNLGTTSISAHLLAASSNTIDLGASGTPFRSGYFGSKVTLSGTGTTQLAVSGAPGSSTISSLVQFGIPITGGSANGTYFGINTASTSSADFLNFQNAGTAAFKVDSAGTLSVAGNAGVTSNCSGGQVLSGAVYTGGIVTGGTCSSPSGFVTLQNAYNNSATTNPQINLNHTYGGVTIADDGGGTTVTGNLFQVTSPGASPTSVYLGVNSTGITTSGILTVSGSGVSTVAGSFRVGSGSPQQFQIDASGNTQTTGTLKVGTVGSQQFQVDGSGNVIVGNVSTAQTKLNNDGTSLHTVQNSSNTTVDTFAVKNLASGSSGTVTLNAIGINLAGTATAGTSNVINGLNFGSIAGLPLANNTFNGLNFGTGYNNLLTSANYTVTAAGSVTQAASLTVQAGGAAITGNTTINNSGSGTTTIGSSSAGTIMLQSGTGNALNLTGGADSTFSYGTNKLGISSANFSLDGATGNIGTNGGYTQSGSSLNTFTGQVLLNRAGTGTSDYTLALSGTPIANAASAQLRLGNAITSGNNTGGTGGTYIGINEPNSGAGSTADFLDFQSNSNTVQFQVTSGGSVIANSSIQGATLSAGSTVNAGTAYKIGGAVGTAGQFLRSDGSTGFVANTLQSSDGAGVFVQKAPSSTANNTIQPTGTGIVALSLKGPAAGGTDHTLDIYNNGGSPTIQSFFDANGILNSSTVYTSSVATLTAPTANGITIQPGTSSSAATGAGVTINANTGTTTNGSINLGSSNTAAVTVGTNFSIGSVLTVNSTTGNVVSNTGSVTVNGISNPSSVTLNGSPSGGGLAASTTFAYRVAAINSSGVSTTAVVSTPASYTTAGGPNNNQTTLSWTAVSGAANYKIYRTINGGTTWFVNTVSSGTTSINDNGTNFTWATSGTPADFSSAGGVVLNGGGGVTFNGTNGGGVTLQPSNSAITNYTLQLPSAQGGVNTVLLNDGSGNLTWTGTAGCSTCIATVPSSTGQNTIQPTANGVVSLTIQGTSGTGTPDILDLRSSGGGTLYASVGSTGLLTLNAGLTVTTGGTFQNNRASLFTALTLGNLSNGAIGANTATVDIATSFNIAETSTSQTLSLPTPTNSSATGRVAYVSNTGSASFTLTYGTGGTSSVVVAPSNTATLYWNGTVWTSAGVDGSGANFIQNQNSTSQTANFQISGTGQANTSFLTPLLDVNSGSALGIGTTAAARTITLGNTNASTVEIFNAGAYSMTVNNTGANINSTTSSGSDLSFGSSSNVVGRTINVVQAASGNGANLTIQAGAAFATGTTTGGNLVLQGGAKGSTGTSGSVVAKASASTDTAAFQIQNSGSTPLLTGDTSSNFRIIIGSPASSIFFTPTANGDLAVVGAAGIVGQVVLGNATGSATFDATNHELLLAGTARHATAYTLVPEYQGAVLTGDGTTNVGTMTSDFCSGSGRLGIPASSNPCASAEEHNYYSWTATATNNYDIFVRYQIPSNFGAFAASNPITMYGWATNTSTDSVSLAMYSGGTLCGGATTVSTSNTTWTSTALGGYSGGNYGTCTTVSSAPTGTNIGPGSIVVLKIHMNVGTTSDFARAGEITINYLSKY